MELIYIEHKRATFLFRQVVAGKGGVHDTGNDKPTKDIGSVGS